MKKAPKLIIATLCLIIMNQSNLFAQSGGLAFEKGTSAINLGWGFGNLGMALFKSFEAEAGYRFKSMGPIHFRYEYGVSDKIGLGLSYNYVMYGAEWTHTGFDLNGNTLTFTDEFKSTGWSILGRMNLHFATSDNLDPYWGIGAGYRNTTWTAKSTDLDYEFASINSPFTLGFETVIGLRYYFTDNIGLYSEIGFAKSVVQIGLAAKF